MNKAIKFRLYPNKSQQEMFIKTFGCCRKVWNLMLNDKINHYEQTKEMLATTPAQYKKEYLYLKEVDSLALANVQLHLQNAYKNFFCNKKVGFPKFKSSKYSRKTYTTNFVNKNIVVTNNSIKLPKIGFVKAKIHRIPNDDWTIKSATISQDNDGKFYASLLFEFTNNIVLVSKFSTNAIGFDYKSDGLYMDSNKNIGTNHKYFRESHHKLAKEQRKLSRMKGSRKGETKSNNWYKQSLKVNKIYKHISNQRLNNLHTISTKIANLYDIVCVETLNMRAMANKGFGNGKATLDNGYGIFLNLLEYKLKDRGKYLVKVDKWYPSSQICSRCGKRHKLKSSDKIYKCECGFIEDRDYNAAINILNEGLRILRTQAA